MTAAAKPKTRPNILLIMTDQQRFDQLGFASGGHYETPNLDRLATNGVIFDAAYSNATICIPSRGSILCGLAPHRYPTQGAGALQEGFWTVAHALGWAGYQTAMIGKMHLHPIRANHGFQHMRMAEHLGLVYGPEDFDDYTRWLVSKGRGDSRATHIFGPGQEKEAAAFRMNQQAEAFTYEKEYHPTNWIARETIEFLQKRDPNKPFFAITSFPHPHSPFDPPAPYDTMYDPADAQLPGESLAMNKGLAPSAADLILNKKGFGFCATEDTGEALQRKMTTYIRALIKQIDDAVGEILSHIDLSNTVVFFTPDHGDYCGHRGLMLKTPGIPFDDIARVPFFCCGAGIPQGKRIASPVQNTDFALTCLDLAGLEPPPPVFDTKSLTPLFNGSTDQHRVCLLRLQLQLAHGAARQLQVFPESEERRGDALRSQPGPARDRQPHRRSRLQLSRSRPAQGAARDAPQGHSKSAALCVGERARRRESGAADA